MADFIMSGGGGLDATGLAEHTTDLGAYTDSLRNVVARPGTFIDLFPETTDDGLLAVLLDAFAEANLEGMLLDHTVSDEGNVSPVLTRGQAALVVLFAGVRFLRAELINRETSKVYKAGSAHYETVQATNILRDILKNLLAQRDRLVVAGSSGGVSSAFYMADQYLARMTMPYSASVAVGW